MCSAQATLRSLVHAVALLCRVVLIHDSDGMWGGGGGGGQCTGARNPLARTQEET